MLRRLGPETAREPLTRWLDHDISMWLEQSCQLARAIDAQARCSAEGDRALWEWLQGASGLTDRQSPRVESHLVTLRALLRDGRRPGRR